MQHFLKDCTLLCLKVYYNIAEFARRLYVYERVYIVSVLSMRDYIEKDKL